MASVLCRPAWLVCEGITYFVTGDPNGSGAPQWTPYDESSGDILQLDGTIASLPGGYGIAQMKFLSTLPIRGF